MFDLVAHNKVNDTLSDGNGLFMQKTCTFSPCK